MKIYLRNHVGIQSKDQSIAVLINNTLSENNTALHAYRKNWQYGTGGQVVAMKSVINSKDGVAVSAEKASAITLFDNHIVGDLDQKRIVALKNDEGDSETAADQNRLLDDSVSSDKVEKMIKELPARLINHVDVSRRGARTDG